MRPAFPVREQGAALIAVLALVMLLAGFASLGLTRLRATADRVTNNEQQFQAGLLAHSGAAIGAQIIGQLKARARSQPRLLQQPLRMALGGGTVELRFHDAGNCFNLNSLLAPAASPDSMGGNAQASPRDFARLLQAAGIAASDAQPIADATARHLQNTGMLWTAPAEWTDVAGVDGAIWAQVRPFLCALPNREASRLNLNSLTLAQAPLLVAAGLDADEARRAITGRPRQGWGSGGEFWQRASASGRPATATAQIADTRSRWISLQVVASMNDTVVHRRFLLDTLNEPAKITASVWQNSSTEDREQP